MKASHILALIQNDFTTVHCKFSDGSRTYTYKALLKDEVKVGDLCIVESSYGDLGYALVKVVGVDDTADIDTSVNYDYKWIVGKVDLTRYTAILEVQERFEKTIRNLHKRQARRQVLDSVVSAFPEDSQERKDLELLVNSGQSLEQIERMITHDGHIANTGTGFDDASPGTGTPSGA